MSGQARPGAVSSSPIELGGRAAPHTPPKGGASVRRAPPGRRDFDFATTIAKKPAYGVLVVLVGAFSLAIPLTLFLWLHAPSANTQGRAPSEVASDFVGRGDAPRPRASSSASDNNKPSGSETRGGSRPGATRRESLLNKRK
jgi:hypothetical protein